MAKRFGVWPALRTGRRGRAIHRGVGIYYGPFFFMQQFLNFLPLPQGHGSLRPTR